MNGTKAWMAQRRGWHKYIDGINSVSQHGMLEVYSNGVFKVYSCVGFDN